VGGERESVRRRRVVGKGGGGGGWIRQLTGPVDGQACGGPSSLGA